MTAKLTLVAAAASETGLVRENNEDAAYSGRWLFAVADGLGGHAAGEVASAAVIESLRSHDAEVAPDILLVVLGLAIAEANREVARRAAADSSRKGMGTTLTAMLWSGERCNCSIRWWGPLCTLPPRSGAGFPSLLRTARGSPRPRLAAFKSVGGSWFGHGCYLSCWRSGLVRQARSSRISRARLSSRSRATHYEGVPVRCSRV